MNDRHLLPVRLVGFCRRATGRRARALARRGVVWLLLALTLGWNTTGAFAAGFVYEFTLSGASGTYNIGGGPVAYSNQDVVFRFIDPSGAGITPVSAGYGNTGLTIGNATVGSTSIGNFSGGTDVYNDRALAGLFGIPTSTAQIYFFRSGEYSVGFHGPEDVALFDPGGSINYQLTTLTPSEGGTVWAIDSIGTPVSSFTLGVGVNSVTVSSFSNGTFEALENRPILQATPGTVNYGARLVGSTTGLNITATNVGTQDGLSGTFNNPASGPFARNGAAAYGPLVVGASDPRQYDFAPTSAGSFSTTVLVTNTADPVDNTSINLQGQGVQPVVNLSAGTPVMDVGPVRVGTTSLAATFTIQNTGNGNLADIAVSSNTDGLGTAGQNDLLLRANSVIVGATGQFNRTGAVLNRGDSVGTTTDNQFGLADPTSSGTSTPGQVQLSYTFTPSGFGGSTTGASGLTAISTLAPGGGGTNNAVINGIVQVTGTGVGPSLQTTYDVMAQSSSGDGTASTTSNNQMQFSDLNVGSTSQLTIRLTNDSNNDGATTGDLLSLTDLGINPADLSAINTQLAGTPFSLVSTSGNSLIQDQSTLDFLDLVFEFAPISGGSFSGTFTLGTDQNEANNDFLTNFTFELLGNAIQVIPEPASIAIWSLLGLALVGFGIRRYRRK